MRRYVVKKRYSRQIADEETSMKKSGLMRLRRCA
jgi:hypothetical protein